MEALLIEQQQQISFDILLNNNRQLSKFQIYGFCIICTLYLAEGAESVIIGFLLPIIKSQWGVSASQQKSLTFFIFAGLAFGSLISGKLSDQIGRKKPILYSALLQCIIGFLSAVVQNFTQLIILRTLYGFAVGIILPTGATYVAEILPTYYRAKGQIFSKFFWSSGGVLAVILAYICLDSLNSGNWRMMLFLTGIPGLFSFIVAIYYLEESPRYLLLNKQDDLALIVLKDVIENNNYSNNKNQIKEELLKWAQYECLQQKENQNDYFALLKDPKYKEFSPKLWFSWFSVSYIYYGLVLLLPIIYELEAKQSNNPDKQNKGPFFYILASTFIELPSIIVATYIVDKPNFGRKQSLIYSFIITAVFCMISYLSTSLSLYSFGIVTQKFFISMAFMCMFAYSAEVYDTLIRGTGMGICSGFARFGAMTMPYLSFYLLESQGIRGPMLGFFVLSFFSSVLIWKLPFDTIGKEMK